MYVGQKDRMPAALVQKVQADAQAQGRVERAKHSVGLVSGHTVLQRLDVAVGRKVLSPLGAQDVERRVAQDHREPGAGGITLLLSQGVSPLLSALCGSALALVAILLAWPRLLQVQGGEAPAFVAPRGIVLLLAALSGLIFLVEGAILDWGALLLLGRDLVDSAAQGAWATCSSPSP